MIKELEVDALKELMDKGQPVRLIDVRSMPEMNGGIIPQAEKLPLHTLPVRLNEIDDKEMCVLYCRSGARSAQAVGFMAAQGYENVYNLRGGIIAWHSSGLPIEACA